jgi:hypothetical protein
MRRIIPASLALFAAALLSVCDSSGPGEPDDPAELDWSDDPCSEGYAASRMTVIGPDGGMVDIFDHPDASSPLEGFQLVVPAGAWAQCWEVEIASSTYGFDTPDYPAGFAPAARDPEGSIEFSIFRQTRTGGKVYAPDSMYVELHFPLRSIPQDARGYAFAFVFDSTALDWRVLIADDADADHLIVHVSDWKRHWSFGSIDLSAVDIERYLTPALAGRIGSAAWNRIEASLDSVYQAAVSQTSVLSCLGLNILEGFFVSARDRSATGLQAIGARVHCGTCDATTGLFWDEWRQYVHDKQTAMIMDMAMEIVGGPVTKGAHWLVEEAVGLLVGKVSDLMMGDYGCDYECFVNAIDWTFFFYLAVYNASGTIIEGIDWYRHSFTTCPAPPVDPSPWAGDAASPFTDGGRCAGEDRPQPGSPALRADVP